MMEAPKCLTEARIWRWSRLLRTNLAHAPRGVSLFRLLHKIFATLEIAVSEVDKGVSITQVLLRLLPFVAEIRHMKDLINLVDLFALPDRQRL